MKPTASNPIIDRYRLAYSVEEAQALTSLGRTKLLELVYSGVIRSKRVGRRRLLIGESLRQFIEAGDDAA